LRAVLNKSRLIVLNLIALDEPLSRASKKSCTAGKPVVGVCNGSVGPGP
jgi:phosphoribosylformylglycinamidine (FGAM) synthase-like amidotransferase family enzyme